MRSHEYRHFLDLSQVLKNSLISKYRELHYTIKACDRPLMGDVVHSGQPRHIRELEYKLNIVKKLLQHEWKLDTTDLI
jgi:hypothetical protein